MDSASFWMQNTAAAKKSLQHTVFTLLGGCGKLEFKRTVYGFSLTNIEPST